MVAGLKLILVHTIDRINEWRSTAQPCTNLCKTLLSHLGLIKLDSGTDTIVKKCLPRLMLGGAVYGTYIGFPVLAYLSAGTDLNLVIMSLGAAAVASSLVVTIGCLLCRGGKLRRMFDALAATIECGTKLTARPTDILQRNKRWTEAPLVYLFLETLGLFATFLELPFLYRKRVFTYALWYPFEVKSTPLYEIVFTLTVVAFTYLMFTFIVTNTLVMALLAEAIGQLRLLSHNLSIVRRTKGLEVQSLADKELVDKTMPDQAIYVTPRRKELNAARERDEALALERCVLHHCSIINLVNEVVDQFNETISHFLFTSLWSTGAAIVLCIFWEANAHVYKIVIMALGGNISLGLVCFMAETLTDESENVQNAAYDCDWFDAADGFKRSLRIMMSRCNQPIVVRVAGFVVLSCETFYAMMKMNYSYGMATLTYYQKNV